MGYELLLMPINITCHPGYMPLERNTQSSRMASSNAHTTHSTRYAVTRVRTSSTSVHTCRTVRVLETLWSPGYPLFSVGWSLQLYWGHTGTLFPTMVLWKQSQGSSKIVLLSWNTTQSRQLAMPHVWHWRYVDDLIICISQMQGLTYSEKQSQSRIDTQHNIIRATPHTHGCYIGVYIWAGCCNGHTTLQSIFEQYQTSLGYLTDAF